MVAGRYDIFIEQGSNKSIPIQFTEDDDTPINLTGYKFAMEIRPAINSSTIYDTLTTENSRITVDAGNGKIYLKFPSATTTAYDFMDEQICNAVYDLEWYVGGEYERKLEGNVTISPEVTHVDLST